VNDCINAEVRDALPDFINHRLSELEATTVREHVESCADCRAEVAILESVRAAAPLAPRLDVNRIAAAVPAYHRIDARSTSFISRRVWALAATALIVAIGGWAVSMRSTSEVSAPAVAVISSAPVATTAETASPSVTVPGAKATSPVQSSGTKQIQVASLSLVGSTDDLSDADLENLVAALDGIDAVPAAEPGSVTSTVEDIGGNDQ
jgi:anti-sigma factor RsiW